MKHFREESKRLMSREGSNPVSTFIASDNQEAGSVARLLGNSARFVIMSFWLFNIYTGVFRGLLFRFSGGVPEWVSYIQEIFLIIGLLLVLVSRKRVSSRAITVLLCSALIIFTGFMTRDLLPFQSILLLRQYLLIPIGAFITVKIFAYQSILRFLLLLLIPSAVFSIFLLLVGTNEAITMLIGASYSGNIDGVGKFATLGSTGYWKSIGTFSQPFTAGFYYSFGLFATYELLKRPVIKLMLSLLFLAALLSTFSRTSYVIVVVFIGLKLVEKRALLVKVFGLTILSLLSLVISSLDQVEKYLTTITRTSSFLERLEIWRYRFGVYLKNASFAEILFGISGDSFDYRGSIGVDNTYNGLVVDVGFVGACYLVILWFVLLRISHQVQMRSLFALFLGVLIAGFTISFSHDKVVFSLVMLISLLCISKKAENVGDVASEG